MDSFSLKYVEPGKLMLNSGLLHKSWRRICEKYESINGNQDSGRIFETYEEARYTIVVFVARPTRYPFVSALTPLTGAPDQNPFHFLCLEKAPLENIPSFSLHTPAYELFDSAKNDLIHLKSELLESKKHVIITGAALGGSVASLFTLWLLEKIDPELRRPLCITFGSPLIGDASLQQILENSLRNSCFLHVADAAQTLTTQGFKPFGTFLICLGTQYICIDDPETVTELLSGANGDVQGWRDYGQVLGRLAQTSAVDPRLTIDDGVIKGMVDRAEKKKLRYDPLTKLNHMKIEMMHLEWYKKKSTMGYYDRFKTMMMKASMVDMVLQRRKKELNDYWISLVAEVEKMPQSEKSLLKTRSLFAGNNYRRLVEPLDIAEYYSLSGTGKREYRTTGRSRHYEMLEKWFEAEKTKQKIKPVRLEGRDLSDLLTFDSCFWSEVEEAMVVINDLKTQVEGREVLFEKLMRFEEYVWKIVEKREVSPEIFLEGSSFMKWWREYKKIEGLHAAPPTPFTEFMTNRKHESYGKAC